MILDLFVLEERNEGNAPGLVFADVGLLNHDAVLALPELKFRRFLHPPDFLRVERRFEVPGVASVAEFAGVAVGFAANMPQETGGGSTWVAPGEGSAWEETLLEGFARLQLHCSGKFVPFLETLTQYRDMDILVLSSYDSESIQQALEQLRRSQHVFLPQRSAEECTASYRRWQRAVERAASWVVGVCPVPLPSPRPHFAIEKQFVKERLTTGKPVAFLTGRPYTDVIKIRDMYNYDFRIEV